MDVTLGEFMIFTFMYVIYLSLVVLVLAVCGKEGWKFLKKSVRDGENITQADRVGNLVLALLFFVFSFSSLIVLVRETFQGAML